MSVGLITGLRTGPRTGLRTGLSAGIYGGFPESAAALKAVTLGYGNWTSIYTFDESSGNLIDKVGTENLIAEITPVYSQTGPTPGKKAILFNTLEDDNFYSGVGTRQLGSGDFTWLTVFKATDVGGTRFTASNQGGGLWQGYVNPSSQYVVDISDGTTAVGEFVNGVTQGVWHVALMTVTRGATQILRLTVDALPSGQSSIAAVGAVNPLNRMRVGAGDFGSGRTGNMTVAYMAFGYSDANNVRLNDAAIIKNFKSNVGML